MKKYCEKRKNLHIVFNDLEKAYGNVPKDFILWFLDETSVPRGHIGMIKDMYKGARTSVRVICGETSEFLVTMGLHRWLPFIPYLFMLIIDEIIAHIQEELRWCMLFANDIVLVDGLR